MRAKRPLRVLHVHSGNLYGGIESLLVTLARSEPGQAGLHWEFALCFPGRLEQELRAAGAAVHPLGEVRARSPLSVLRARSRLRSLLREREYDAAICHSTWAHALLGPTVRAEGVPLVFWQHGPADGGHWLDRLARRVRPALALSNSEFSAGSLDRLFPGVPREVAHPMTLPAAPLAPAARCALRRELDTPCEAVVIVHASRLEGWKGHALLLDALGSMKDVPGWVCWLAGGAQRAEETGYLDDLRARAGALGIADRVRFLGQRDDVRQLLAAADVHCQPNTGPEPFGIAFVEALYAGLPVVTTAMGGALEIVDESCGVLVEPAPGPLAAALRRLVADPAARARLGAAGPARARALTDPSVQLPRLAGILERVAAR